MIQGILFDFFGTLVEYSPNQVQQPYNTTYGLLRQQGISVDYETFSHHWNTAYTDLSQWSHNTQREFSTADIARRFLTRIAADHHASTFADELGATYVWEWSDAVKVRYLPGIRDFIQLLSATLPLGIVTNTHYAPLISHHLFEMGLQNDFQTIVTSVEHGRPKPHPDIFASALHALGCASEQTLFVGDSYTADYLGATQSGMSALLIDPEASSPAPAHRRIASLFEVEQHLPALG